MKEQTFLIDPAPGWPEVLRYGCAMIVAGVLAATLTFACGRGRPSLDASDVDSAILIDLPAAEASSRQTRPAEDGPEQIAAPATPIDDMRPKTDTPVKAPPPPVSPEMPIPIQEPVKPPPTQASAIPPQEDRAPAGSDGPTKPGVEQGDEPGQPASAHAITLWQKALMRRLESAKRALGHEARSAGTVTIAFAIDGAGALVSERIAESSGSATLDKAASILVRLAAPFPTPPAGARATDLSFVVPIRFRR